MRNVFTQNFQADIAIVYQKIVPITYFHAMSQLRQLVAGFPPRLPGFNPRALRVGFVLEKMALGLV
jgi:hypothetical protein